MAPGHTDTRAHGHTGAHLDAPEAHETDGPAEFPGLCKHLHAHLPAHPAHGFERRRVEPDGAEPHAGEAVQRGAGRVGAEGRVDDGHAAEEGRVPLQRQVHVRVVEADGGVLLQPAKVVVHDQGALNTRARGGGHIPVDRRDVFQRVCLPGVGVSEERARDAERAGPQGRLSGSVARAPAAGRVHQHRKGCIGEV